MTASENLLIDKAIHGDQEALSDLLKLSAPAVRQSLHGRISQRHAGLLSEEDVLQATFLDAFLDIDEFKPHGDGSFTAWLVTVACRNLGDAVRMLDAGKRSPEKGQIQSNQHDSMADLLEIVESSITTPSRFVARDEALAALRKAIDGLSEAHRQVVEMYDLQERPVDEVAEVLGRSPGAVFMLRARAHRRLAKLIGPAGRFLSGSA